MNAYPESVRFGDAPVTSGACITPSQFAHEAVILRPVKENERDDPLDERLVMRSEPVPRKVTPVAVEPLK